MITQSEYEQWLANIKDGDTCLLQWKTDKGFHYDQGTLSIVDANTLTWRKPNVYDWFGIVINRKTGRAVVAQDKSARVVPQAPLYFDEFDQVVGRGSRL